jgi:hypothetical protein
VTDRINEREPGFYRVLTGEEEWVIARWVDGDQNPMLADGWYLCGDDFTYKDRDFIKIGAEIQLEPLSDTSAAELRQRAQLASAAAIANARGMRRGVPLVTNILDLLPKRLRDEVMEDARDALAAAAEFYPTLIQHSPVVRHKNTQRTTR